MGGVGNGAAEEDWRSDLNLGTVAMQLRFGTTRLGQRRTGHFFGTTRLWCFFLGPCGLGREETQTSISFSEIRYPRLGRGERKDCVFVGVLKDFGISMKTLSHYS